MAINIHSDDWKAVEQFLNDELKKSRKKLEDTRFTHDQSQVERGRIALAKSLIKHAKEMG